MGKTGNKRKGPSPTPASYKKGCKRGFLSPAPHGVGGLQRGSPSPTPSNDSIMSTCSSSSTLTSELNTSAQTTKPTTVQNPTTPPPPKKNPIKPPPIILTSTFWRKIAPSIYKLPNIFTTSFTAKTSSTGQIFLQTSDQIHFRLFQKTLMDNQTEFHTFSLPEDRTLKVVLKGIPTDITPSELKSELELLNFQPKYIRRFGTPNKTKHTQHKIGRAHV